MVCFFKDGYKLFGYNGEVKMIKVNSQYLIPQVFFKEFITFVEDRAEYDRRYAIDATKIEKKLGWKSDENFESGIAKTIEWDLK